MAAKIYRGKLSVSMGILAFTSGGVVRQCIVTQVSRDGDYITVSAWGSGSRKFEEYVIHKSRVIARMMSVNETAMLHRWRKSRTIWIKGVSA